MKNSKNFRSDEILTFEQIQSLISRIKSSLDKGKSSLVDIENANRSNHIDNDILNIVSRAKKILTRLYLYSY